MTEFEEVYERYFRDVYRYTLSLSRDKAIAEEITQETFFKALRRFDQFDGRCRIYVWLCEIAKNTYISQCRKTRHLQLPCDGRAESENPEEHLAEREDVLQIHRILHGLKEPYKEVFSLRVFGELSFRQIAELFGKTESWARVTYYRAKMSIREEME